MSSQVPLGIITSSLATAISAGLPVSLDFMGGMMNTKTALKRSVINDGAENIRHWSIECPFTGRLVGADIGPRPVPSGSFTKPLIEVKRCSLWPEKADCGQDCVRNT